jgi:hypothetical protein
MRSVTSLGLKLTAACGHGGTADLHFRSSHAKAEQKSDFETMICDDCRAQIREWIAADHGTEKFAMDFPELHGTPRRVDWAIDIRKKRYERIGPLMLTLSRMPENELAKATWKALYISLMVQDAVNWIENKDIPLKDLFLSFEVSNIMKDPGRNKGAVMGGGPFDHFRQKAPYVLQRIALFDPAILQTVEVMPTIYTGF